MTMRLKRRASRVRRGDFKLGKRFVCATRHRDFSANDIDQIGFTRLFTAGLFGDFRQTCRAFGDDRVGQRNRIILAGHTAVEVDLFEPGCDIAFDKIVSIGHRLLRGQVLPAVWP